MRKKDELKIDVLSGIDDKFIDKVSAKRYSLLNRKKMPKWIIPSAAAAILVAIMIPVLLTLLVKQVPIYEGMTVLENYNGTSSVSIEPERRGNGFDFLSDTRDNNGNGNNGDNGNHNGHKKKPVDEIIEEDSSISLEIPDQKMYYAKPDQDIYINVHISNPDSFEILSFTLNGKKYSSYMFEDGSDMENLILKVNVGDAKGVIEYTIDAIKYVDGTEIKDVIMEGDRTIKVGVYSAGMQPKISASNEFIGINEVSLEVDLSDKFELIERCGGKAYAFICDDEKLLGSKTVDLGYNKIEFKNLKTNTTYTYGVFAYYDALDGKGMEKHILFEKEFTTKTVVAVKDPEIAQESISFNVVFNELFKSKKLSAMTLYLGESKVAEVNVSGDITKKTFTLTKLLSNNEYRLVLKYENLGKTETVEYTFKTLEKATPDFKLTEAEKTQTSFKFDIAVADIDNVGAISKIELVHGEDVTNVENLATRELAGLLSNNDYTVKVTYTYDLNDGVGKQTLVKELTVRTKAKATPDFTLTETEKTQTSFKFDITVTDVDKVGEISKMELIHGDYVTNVEDLTTREFADLLSNNDYTVKVTYTYDLNDGVGKQTLVKELTIKTEEKAEPTFTITNVTADTYTISGSYEKTNTDNTLISYSVTLYKGDELISESAAKKIDFSSLDYYTGYTVKIIYTFDVNDGRGVQEKSVTENIKTEPYIDVQDVVIRNPTAVSVGETIYLQVDIVNPCNADITEILINGKTYTALDSSTAECVFVEITCDETLGSGEVSLAVKEISAYIDEASYNVTPKSIKSDLVYINGLIELVSIEFVNEQFEPTYYHFKGDKCFLKITLNNPTDYEITGVNLYNGREIIYSSTAGSIIRINQNEFIIDATKFGGPITAVDICYSNQYISKSVKFENVLAHRVILPSTEKIYISNAQEFLDMCNGGEDNQKYYELTADIDLSGIQWIPCEFYGVLNGNGFSIKNLSFIGSEYTPSEIGLFSVVAGGIHNVKFQNLFIMVNGLNANNIGIIIGENYGQITNCYIDESSVINAESGRIGAFIRSNYGIIDNCVNNADIVGDYAAAIAYENSGIISDCTNNGTIYIHSITDPDNAKIHGIVQSSGTGAIEKGCINNGKIIFSNRPDIPPIG